MRLSALALLLPLALVPGLAWDARADDIHAGNWEFTTRTDMPGLDSLQGAGGSRLPAGVSIVPGGITHTHTSCVSADKPFPTETNTTCTIEKNERHGAAVNWAATCTTPHGQAHMEGSATYSGDTMEGTATSRIIGKAAHSVDTTTHTTGKYLGPCPG